MHPARHSAGTINGTAEIAATSTDAAPPVRAAAGALTTTIAVSVPVFLVGSLAEQISDELLSRRPSSG
jgi:hypothetical protein